MALLGTVLVAGASTADTGPPAAQDAEQPTADQAGAQKGKRKPNIVFILTDDLSKNLVKHMSAVRALKRNGTTFRNQFVTDSLCCPSRATILTGEYPHNTGVRVNEGDRKIPGGFRAFVQKGNGKRTYAVELNKAGYRTGFMGKYLNGYKVRKHNVPRGWDEWHVTGSGYSNMAGSYLMTRVRQPGGQKNLSKPNVYLNDLFGLRGRAFITRAKQRDQPFFLQISSFAPHIRVDGKKNVPKFPPAKRDRRGRQYAHGDCGTKPGGGRYDCADLHVKRTGEFSKKQYRELDRNLRSRVRMMQSLNDTIIKVRKHLRQTGQLSNTYFVFSSDNGFHLGQHGLFRGKGTAYDHDTNVPLIVKGPGVRKGQVRNEITQTTDFYPTFQQMAGLKPPAHNGRSLMMLLRGRKPQNWRDGALVEHKPQQRAGKKGSGVSADPDLDPEAAARARAAFNPGFHAYNALRTKKWLYVEYPERRELYNLAKDKGQNHNVYSEHRKKAKKLSRWLKVYRTCGPDSTHCWKAGHARFQNAGAGAANASRDFPFPGADTMALHNGSGKYVTYGATAHGRKVPYAVHGSGKRVGSSPKIAGDAMPSGGGKWVDKSKNIWTPGAFYLKKKGVGRYYLFYTGLRKKDDRRCIGVAVSKKPFSGFRPAPRPLVCPNKGNRWALDADVTRRPGSAIWLTWRDGQRARGPESALSVMLLKFHNNGTVSRASKPHVLLRSGNLAWAHYRDNKGVTVIENPSAILHRNHWYLFYSGNTWQTNYYSTGVAYCGKRLNAGTCKPLPGPRKAWFSYAGPKRHLPDSMRVRGLPGNKRGPGAMDVYRARGGKPWVTWNYLSDDGGRKSRTGRLIIKGTGDDARFRVR